jgi:hypothetical protein
MLDLKQYMDYAEDEKDRGFFEAWETIFEGIGAQKVLFCSSSYWGYGGSIDIDILLSDGRVLSYEYGFDSCCDRLEGACEEGGDNTDIEEDITTHATYFDNLTQYDAWVDTLPPDGWGDWKEENERKAFRRNNRAIVNS